MTSVDHMAVLASLTLEEKISLLAGANFWETTPIPTKGVPAVKLSDGPNGARGAAFANGTTAACFPAACCVASTFDVDLARRIGSALAEETQTKGARCILAPTMCIQRHPLGGRNFETFSEDPFLTGKMAAQLVTGIQDLGVAATIKHYAVNEQETDRLTIDVTVGERALREIYLKPFEIAVKEAKPLAVMTAYNMINGHHADSNEFLLKKVLRGDWKWEGLVMSDWGGTNSTAAAINAGMDLEMPGPTRFRQVEAVVETVKSGQVSEQTIDDRVLRILEFLERLGCFEDDLIPEEKAVNKPEHQALIREVGAKGIVMLKNSNHILPLSKEKVKGKRIALLGYAKIGMAHGGGSASVLIMDKVGRVKLLVIGGFGSALIVGLMGGLEKHYLNTTYMPGVNAAVALYFIFGAFFTSTIECTAYVYGSEIWPTRLRSEGATIVYASFFANAVAYAAPVQQALDSIGWKYYMIFVAVTAVSTIVLAFYFPETKGLSLEEINAKFGDTVVINLEDAIAAEDNNSAEALK